MDSTSLSAIARHWHGWTLAMHSALWSISLDAANLSMAQLLLSIIVSKLGWCAGSSCSRRGGNTVETALRQECLATSPPQYLRALQSRRCNLLFITNSSVGLKSAKSRSNGQLTNLKYRSRSKSRIHALKFTHVGSGVNHPKNPQNQVKKDTTTIQVLEAYET